jgi:hypothetical protein
VQDVHVESDSKAARIRLEDSFQLQNSTIALVEAHHFDPGTYRHNLTIVSVLYDIKRDNRPMKSYFRWLRRTFDLRAPFVLFTESKYKQRVLSLVPETTPLYLVIVELEDLVYYKDLKKVAEIIQSDEYKLRMPRSDRIECVNPLYTILMFSKFTFMEMSSGLNPFKSSRFMWVDAGASRFFGDFDLSRPLTGQSISADKFLLIMQREFFERDVFFERNPWGVESFAVGTLLAGSAASIRQVSAEVYFEWCDMLRNKVVNNEQIVLQGLYLRRPDLFQLFIRPSREFVFGDFFRYVS